MALNEGNQIKNTLNSTIVKLKPKIDINIFNWNDIHDDEYQNKINIVQDYYNINPKFKELIDNAASEFAIRRRPNFSFKPKNFNSIVQYLIWETPMFLCGININNIKYNTLLYPSWENITIGIGNIGERYSRKKKIRRFI